ncbi:MAG TPA: DUF4255 domain-containing protein [Thermoanaerobaculia bacterium]|nr:DUF4255 domain-containing protein [Thermoanaerobaculia bacterium]
MSKSRAIGAVSETLRDLLEKEMNPSAPVSVAPLDVAVTTITGKRVNLFLYKIDESAALKNMDLRSHPRSFGRPPLALELHYLVTAYGENEEDQVETQQILGEAMRVLHDHAVILGNDVLDPDLQNEIEHVKLYLEPMTLEDLTKIWSASTKPYRTSVSYLVTVIQIESQHPRKFAPRVGEPPVGGPRIKAVTFRAPHIDSILTIRHDDPNATERNLAWARIGDTLVLRGSGFTSGGLRVLLGGVQATVKTIDTTHITVTIPDDVALQPGPVRVSVENDLMLGEPETPHRGFSSNVAVFVLVPEVDTLTKLPGNKIRLEGTRLSAEKLDSLTIVGAAVFATYTLAEPGKIELDIPGVPDGAHAVRVRVNGAESFDDVTLVLP